MSRVLSPFRPSRRHVLTSLGLGAFAGAVTLPGAAQAEPVRGSGSTFVAPLMERWQRRFRDEQTDGGDQLSVDLGVDYSPIGSLGGVLRATQPGVDFGLTERPLTTKELADRGLGQFPVVMGGIALVVNLAGVAPGALKLTGEIIADIYLGKVTSWDDAAIRALNPGLALPAATITVTHRKDGSGTTFNFTEFLSRRSEEFRRRLGADTLISWPVGTGHEGNGGVASAVMRTPNAIGYVDAGRVARQNLTDAAIANRTGAFVRPQPAALAAAALAADWAAASDFDLLLLDPPGADAYPIVATVFAVVSRERWTVSRRNMWRFFTMALDRGAEDALALGYVPLPPALVTRVKAYWRATFPRSV